MPTLMVQIKSIQLMCAQHDALRELADRYRAQIVKDAPDLSGLSDCRWRLLRLVTAHLAYEDAHLYAALAPCEAETQATGRRLAAEGGQLFADFQDHVREWTGARIEQDWAIYCASARRLLDALVLRMDREEAELYPLLVLAKAA